MEAAAANCLKILYAKKNPDMIGVFSFQTCADLTRRLLQAR